ncbi:AAA family ATPase [Helicobacter suis]|uniref:AAA family ATPase n=1 Tax=Helicobacter suis TaxID=104628 RepID=UPI001F087DAE|nr:AAA family ATPase [Helicobacter suis]
MQNPKNHMGRHELEKYLLEHGIDEADKLVEKAFERYGWVDVSKFESQNPQVAQIAWRDITGDCEFYREKWCFFPKIFDERQKVQPMCVFESRGVLEEILLALAKHHHGSNPILKMYEDELVEEFKQEYENDEDADDVDDQEILEKVCDKAFDKWMDDFRGSLELGFIEETSQIEVDVERLAFIPKHVRVVLEKYRQGDTYVFTISDSSPDAPVIVAGYDQDYGGFITARDYSDTPKAPKYDRRFLCAFLCKKIEFYQKKVEEIAVHLARFVPGGIDENALADQIISIKDKNAFADQIINFKLARLCLKWHYGLITPESITEFQLGDPKNDDFFIKRRFIHKEQENYYIAEALLVWALENLLEIFSESGVFEPFKESKSFKGIRQSLLARLNPTEILDFEEAFYKRNEKLCMKALAPLLIRMDFPIAVFKDEKGLIFTKNPHFKPHTLLNEGVHNLGILRALFSFGRLLKEVEIKEITDGFYGKIPTYVVPSQAEQFTDPQDKYSPKAIKRYLDQHVIGQKEAKVLMSLVFSDHYKRINGRSSMEKHNALCIGPSGSGKTFLIEKATEYLDIPYFIINIASCTPTGYKGEEAIQTMFSALYANALAKANNDRKKAIEIAQKGVVVLDEIDKLGQGDSDSREWRQGVQNELLKVVERGKFFFEYNKETISLKTDNILFIGLGHFEKLWHGNAKIQQIHPIGFISTKSTKHSQTLKSPQFSNEDLMRCGMKREFLRRFSVRAIFNLVDIDMLTELFDRRLKPFQEEFQKKEVL